MHEDDEKDYTDWTWFDYRLFFDASDNGFAVAIRLEALGIPLEYARFIGFPPDSVWNDDWSRKESYGSNTLRRKAIAFYPAERIGLCDVLEALMLEDGLDIRTAIRWAELHHTLGVDDIRELRKNPDIDPRALRRMIWEEMFSEFDFALNVYLNEIDLDMAHTLNDMQDN